MSTMESRIRCGLVSAGSCKKMATMDSRIRRATYSEPKSVQLGIPSHQTPTTAGIISEIRKKRTRQEEEEWEEELEHGDEENVSPSPTKRNPTLPHDLENEKQKTLVETPVDLKLTDGYDITGNVSYRSSKQEMSSDSEDDDDDATAAATDDDDDDDDDDGITVIIGPPGACTPQANAAAVLRNNCLASSPKFDVEGILRMYDDLVLYDFT